MQQKKDKNVSNKKITAKRHVLCTLIFYCNCNYVIPVYICLTFHVLCTLIVYCNWLRLSTGLIKAYLLTYLLNVTNTTILNKDNQEGKCEQKKT